MKTHFKINIDKKIALLLLVLLLATKSYCHSIDPANFQLREWSVNNAKVKGSFLMMKDNNIYLEDEKNRVLHFPLASFCKVDQQFINQEYRRILKLNTESSIPKKTETFNYKKLIGAVSILVLLLMATYFLAKKNKLRYVACFFIVGIASILYSFKALTTTTDPAVVDLAFAPFKPNVYTSWDNTYFYVESKGIPTTHLMMTGITGWQQQVPIPQCYIGSNHWSIPLNPVMGATPVPVNSSHFLKGAVAIAVNGIAIFNPYTNTGVDAFLDGQLDQWGGHCGRADDYHYHTAPLHLYGTTSNTLPIAYALDGYAIYGNVEPDGTGMKALDYSTDITKGHGHLWNGVYHYHGTVAAPYMIGNMVGQFTEDANLQIIPQALSHPVRTENWGPLAGALITSCVANATNNGYNLSYTLNGVAGYATNFSWSGTTYTFKYVTPTGTTTTNYNGFSQCTVPVLSNVVFTIDTKNIALYPNPAHTEFTLELNNAILPSDVKNISIFGVNGKLVFSANAFQDKIKTSDFVKGMYYVFIKTSNTNFTKKLIVN